MLRLLIICLLLYVVLLLIIIIIFISIIIFILFFIIYNFLLLFIYIIIINWRASVASETLTGVTQLKIGDICLYICLDVRMLFDPHVFLR